LHSHVQHGGLPVERFVRLINEAKKSDGGSQFYFAVQSKVNMTM